MIVSPRKKHFVSYSERCIDQYSQISLILPVFMLQSQILSYIVIFLYIISTLVILILLLWVLRPTKNYLGHRAILSKLDIAEPYIMWPRDYFPRDKKEYISSIKKLPNEIEKNLMETHYTLLQLIERKYRYYAVGVLIMKYLIVIFLIGTVLYGGIWSIWSLSQINN